jgi:hypothetical protein
MYIEGKPSAFWLGCIHGNTLSSNPGGTGYDPRFRKYGIGTLLMWKIIEDLCKDDRIRYIDFGRGDSSYKRRICDLNWKAADFYIFQPTSKGVRLNMMRSVTGAFHQLGNFILKRMKVREKWIKFNRHRFTPNHYRT